MNINIKKIYSIPGRVEMGKFGIIKNLVKIDKECKKDDGLRHKLEPWVKRMNKVKPSNKAEALKVAQQLIDEYERLKSEINEDINRSVNESGNLRKIEQINER